MTMHSNDTFGNTSFNWTSNYSDLIFFHANQGVYCFWLSMFLKLSKLSSMGRCVGGGGGGGGGGGDNRLAKQAAEFPQVLACV